MKCITHFINALDASDYEATFDTMVEYAFADDNIANLRTFKIALVNSNCDKKFKEKMLKKIEHYISLVLSMNECEKIGDYYLNHPEEFEN